jgi:YVTN family beta-propeller protein
MATNRLVETVDLQALGFSPNAKPHHTAVEPDGSFWYVTLITDGKVLKFDRENRLVGQVDFETPGMLGLDSTSDRLYVGRSMAAVNPPQRVGVIDRGTMEIEEIDVFVARPHAIAVDPRGGRFFTAGMDTNGVAYAPLGAEDVDLIDLGGHHHHMVVQFAVSPDGHWMAGGGQMSGDLVVLDLVSGPEPTVARTVAVGEQPFDPTFTPDGSALWIPNQTGNSVTVIDTKTWTVTDVVRHPAIVAPHGSAVSPDGRTIYVSSHNDSGAYRPAGGGDGRPGTVVAIDAQSHEVVAVIEVGRYAVGMATRTVTPH